MKRLKIKSLAKETDIVSPKDKEEKDMQYKELIKMHKALGNKLMQDFLESEGVHPHEETVYGLDPMKSLAEDIKNNYVREDKKLKEYIPSISEKREKGEPEKDFDLSLDTGDFVGGRFEGDKKWIFVSMLKNAPNQTVNMEDMKKVQSGRAKKESISHVNYMSNHMHNSATAMIMSTSKNAKKFLQNIQSKIESDHDHTLNKVFPFISTKDEKEKINNFKKNLDALEDREKMLQNTVVQKESQENIFFKKEYKRLKFYEEKIKQRIEQYKNIIQRKTQKKNKFQKTLRVLLENIEKKKRKLEYIFPSNNMNDKEYKEKDIDDNDSEKSQNKKS